MYKKDQFREQIINFISNPDNGFVSRCKLAHQLEISRSALYKNFTPEELDAIEREALDMRRKRYSRHLAEVDVALLYRAKTGDPQACRLAYQRFEGWSERSSKEDLRGNVTLIMELTPEDADTYDS